VLCNQFVLFWPQLYRSVQLFQRRSERDRWRAGLWDALRVEPEIWASCAAKCERSGVWVLCRRNWGAKPAAFLLLASESFWKPTRVGVRASECPSVCVRVRGQPTCVCALSRVCVGKSWNRKSEQESWYISGFRCAPGLLLLLRLHH